MNIELKRSQVYEEGFARGQASYNFRQNMMDTLEVMGNPYADLEITPYLSKDYQEGFYTGWAETTYHGTV